MTCTSRVVLCGNTDAFDNDGEVLYLVESLFKFLADISFLLSEKVDLTQHLYNVKEESQRGDQFDILGNMLLRFLAQT